MSNNVFSSHLPVRIVYVAWLSSNAYGRSYRVYRSGRNSLHSYPGRYVWYSLPFV